MRTFGDAIDAANGTANREQPDETGNHKLEIIAGFPSGSFEKDSDPGFWTGTGTESEPEPAATGTGTGKRRGRPPGTKNRTSKETIPSDLAAVNQRNLAGFITTAHVVLANLTGIKELGLLSESDAQEYAVNVTEVAKYYVKEIDPKAIAIFNLVTFQCGLYIGMFKQYRDRTARTIKPATEPQPKPVNGAAQPQSPGRTVFVVPPGAGGNFEP